jgi:UDP-N-acetyl-D-mannosaminuronic acid dehydrogenase
MARVKDLFDRIGVESLEVELEEAELTKLFLNAWRYIQFAVGNQFYTMATERGLDYRRIYHAMTHHYKRGDLPGPGFAAGPCLLKDTMQLAAAYRNQFFLGHAAMMVNEGLPGFLVDALERDTGSPRGKKVGILGMAFKKDIDDTRDALSFKLKKILLFRGATVLCSDEFAHDPSFVSKEQLIASCNIIIVGVPHTAYRELMVPSHIHVVDLWRALPGKASRSL